MPQERVAHAAAVNENSVMMIYGRSIKNGGLVEDERWFSYLNEGKEGESEWKKYKMNNKISSGPRYGHSLSYIKPKFVLFGGNFNLSLSNEVWLVNINEEIGKWRKINFKSDLSPCPRFYHTCIKCNFGKIKEIYYFL